MPKVTLFTKIMNNKLLYSTKTYGNLSNGVDKYSSVFGKSAGDYLLKEANTLKNKNNIIKIKEKNMSLNLINSALYPIKDLPIELFESFLLKLKKIAPKSNKINSLLNSKIIKQHKLKTSSQANESAISNCLQKMTLSDNEIFELGQHRLNPMVSNYSSEKERAVNRLSSGIVPAIFFANDAYNQSIMVNDNKSEAKIEKKSRFKQEVARIGIMAYAQYVILGACSKFVNKSPLASIMITTGIVGATEILSRILAKKPVTFAQPKSKDNEDHPIVDIANDKSTTKHYSKLLKITSSILALGAIATVAKKSPLAKKIMPQIKQSYNNLITKNSHLSKKEFETIMNKLEDSGFENMAKNYRNIASKQNSNNIYIGRQNKKILHPIIDSIIMPPLKGIYNLATLPFRAITKEKIISKPETKTGLESLSYIKSIMNRKDFSKKLNKKILSSFDTKTKATYSNHNVASYSKITTSAVSTYFITADSYNMVTKNENNKEKAKNISKHVLLQRGVNIGLGAYIMTALTNTFKIKYNRSLYGVAMIAGAFGLLNEGISRALVGIPLTEKTKEEQIKLKKNHKSIFS